MEITFNAIWTALQTAKISKGLRAEIQNSAKRQAMALISVGKLAREDYALAVHRSIEHQLFTAGAVAMRTLAN